jgi:hypothetical protein
MKSLESDEGIKPQVESKEKTDFSLDSDSEEGEQVVGFDIDTHFIDEKAAAIHAIGNISLNCSSLMFPFIEHVVKALLESGFYMHENIRYHVCLTLTQIAIGLQRHLTGFANSDDHFKWTPGLPTQNKLHPDVL